MNKAARKYFKADLVAVSPLKLASGMDGLTDSDVLTDATGAPFIPGSTLCGVFRHHAKALHADEFVGRCPYDNYWFGYIEQGIDGGAESLIKFHDAFPSANATVSTRDGVRLDEFKTAVDQSKHDYQVVDAGARFVLRIEVAYDPEAESSSAATLLSDMVNGVQSGEVRVGGKTSRGFGVLRLEDMRVFDIDLRTPEGIDAYIGFDWDGSAFAPFVLTGESRSAFEPEIRVPLKVASSLMIRDYGTLEPAGHEDKLVDAETLKGPDSRPIIPGTSWAGAFRGHMLKVLKAAKYDEANGGGDTAERFVNRVFGSLDGERAVASKIVFSESVIDGSLQLNSTRNAIDRFTGGAADQKLFTNRLSYGGSTELVIRWKKDMGDGDKRLLESLVRVCIDDLRTGMLAIGGMTSTGSGVFERGEYSEGEGVL